MKHYFKGAVMLFHSSEQFTLYNGDSKQILPTLPENSIDSIVTDPPYELGFMGKSWDSTGVANDVDLWKEVLRVLKPGGHLLSFGGSRTYHRMAVAIEDAGFEIRDQIMWVYGSGFPKSHNLKDKWQGWGTALKPAHEPIVLARKPFTGTVANNVLTYGTGGINIDGSRVGNDLMINPPGSTNPRNSMGDGWRKDAESTISIGRWPANFIHDGSDEVVELFPDTKSGAIKPYVRNKQSVNVDFLQGTDVVEKSFDYSDSGSAARFFYCAKASKSDRNEGLDGFEAKYKAAAEFRPNHMEKAIEGESGNPFGRFQPVANNHPTVKPTDLMCYLCKLITPPGGTILDPFLGSGSTGKAAMYEGFKFVGIELTEEYLPIAKARIEFALANLDEKLF